MNLPEDPGPWMGDETLVRRSCHAWAKSPLEAKGARPRVSTGKLKPRWLSIVIMTVTSLTNIIMVIIVIVMGIVLLLLRLFLLLFCILKCYDNYCIYYCS